jgi:hypothetical protein
LRPANCIQNYKKNTGFLNHCKVEVLMGGRERDRETERKIYIYKKKIGEKEERKSGKTQY